MRDIHIIRLRGPWRVQTAGGGQPVTIKMPASWSAIPEDMAPGEVLFTRHFNSPTGLEDLEQVWLVVELPGKHGAVLLNDDPLGQVGESPFRAEITSLLKERNKLEILVAPGDNESADASVGEVRLEIGFP